MKLIIGGAFQGKRKMAETLFGMKASELADGAFCSMEDIFVCGGIFHFHEYIRRMLLEKRGTEELVSELLERNPNIVLISTELGYGIVPMDPFDRLYREKVGRICTEAAEHADCVCRVIAGIPVFIKGKQP